MTTSNKQTQQKKILFIAEKVMGWKRVKETFHRRKNGDFCVDTRDGSIWLFGRTESFDPFKLNADNRLVLEKIAEIMNGLPCINFRDGKWMWINVYCDTLNEAICNVAIIIRGGKP